MGKEVTKNPWKRKKEGGCLLILYSAVKIEVKVGIRVQFILIEVTAPEDHLVREVSKSLL